MSCTGRKPHKLKVWGGLTFVQGGGQTRTIVATRTQKEAAELLKISLYEFQIYWCQTGKNDEIAMALAEPGKLLYPKGRGNR